MSMHFVLFEANYYSMTCNPFFFAFFQIIVGDGEINRQMICCGYFCAVLYFGRICHMEYNLH